MTSTRKQFLYRCTKTRASCERHGPTASCGSGTSEDIGIAPLAEVAELGRFQRIDCAARFRHPSAAHGKVEGPHHLAGKAVQRLQRRGRHQRRSRRSGWTTRGVVWLYGRRLPREGSRERRAKRACLARRQPEGRQRGVRGSRSAGERRRGSRPSGGDSPANACYWPHRAAERCRGPASPRQCTAARPAGGVYDRVAHGELPARRLKRFA